MVLAVLEGRREGRMWPLLYQRLGLMSKVIPHDTIFLPKLRNILSHTLHIMFLMQPIAPPSYPHWHAPTPQNHPPPPQVHQNTGKIPFRPRPQYKKGSGVKDEFTPIGRVVS